MENRKSKVVATSLKKEGTGNYGPYYIHLIVFENGDSGDYMAKKNPQDYFIVGREADYTKETKQNGQYTNTVIKPIQQGQQGGNFFKGSPTAMNRRTALECSVSLVVAGKSDISKVLETATKFSAWLNDEPKTPQQQASASLPPPPQPSPYPSNDPTDDLPF